MRQDERAPFHAALERSRTAAFAPGEYVGQEGFMRAGEIRRLAGRARIGPGTSVLDVCCGVAGPGRMIAAELGCRYLGVDYSAGALAIARRRSANLPCRFRQVHVPPLPDGRFDVVLLLETMLAFPDKPALLDEVARVLPPGGRFACTVEEGPPLTARERARMPDADTVTLVQRAELTAAMRAAGLAVTWQDDHTAAHRATAEALLRSFEEDAERIARGIGTRALDELLAAHRLWCDWLGSGRVRKRVLVAERR